jgi:hypothetical protein
VNLDTLKQWPVTMFFRLAELPQNSHFIWDAG